MRRVLLLWFTAMVCVSVALFGWGCDGDDDDDTTTVVVTNGAAADDDDEPGPETLASDSAGVTSGGPAVNAGTFEAPGDGSIVAVVTWGEATQLTVFFKKGGPENFGWVQGDSPLTSTCEPVADGESCTLYLVNSGGVDADASYTVTFVPD